MSVTFSMPQRKLTWLITGCSSGFGLSLARFVQAGGHNLIATSRNPSRTPELVAEVEGQGGIWIQLDVDSHDSPKVIDGLEKSGVKIDVLVNNAGFSIYAPVETSTEDEVRAQMETMYFGTLRLIRAVVPYMRARRFGIITNFSSGASLDGRETMGAYAGAKAAADAVTKVLAKEVAPFNIRTLTVVLGGFNTNMPKVATFGKNPLPEEYKGSMVDKMIQYMFKGNFPVDGDKDKAMKAVYELVVGDGFGVGHETEKLIPLGKDMTTRVEAQANYLLHSLEVFGTITNNVSIDK
ncbi:hypothetical protein F4775DRAFT_586027 [Biscogniauxia sp. FL1348]|nr:hypothetical protein F4775DRAFT_586027 [Biscogniauxia sp. FL1348]